VVTGGAGFIGRHVVNALRAGGHDVLVVDIKGDDVCRVDILDTDKLIETLKGYSADAIFHLAAVADAKKALADPVRAVNVDVGGTVSMLEAARQADVKRVMLASTLSVCGAMKRGFIDESEPFLPTGTGHIYSSARVACEFLAHDFNQLHGLPFTILRYSTIYGPGMWQGLALRSFLDRAFAGQPLIVYGDGSTSRRFLFVDDVARAHVLALKDEAQNQIYNLQGTRSVTIKELAELVSRLLGGIEIEYRQEGGRFGDPQYDGRDTSSAKAYAELGWKPEVDLEEGVRRTIEWYRANMPKLRAC
jgi:nucleoside-diphosphate-sugar epimerase